MKKQILVLLIYALAILTTSAQDVNRNYLQFNENKDFIEIFTNDGKYIIKPYNDKLIETSFIPKGEEFNPNSHAVVLIPQNIEKTVVENNNTIEYQTKGIKVIIQKNPFDITYVYKDNIITSEKEGYYHGDEYETLSFDLDKSEKLFGGGARVLGMDRRGNRLQLYNRAHYGYTTHSELMNFTMPLVLSSKMYAIHFDNAPIGYLDLDSEHTNTLRYETISGRKTYQVIVGDSWPDLIDQYTDLTGKQPLPPRWAFGNFSSRFGYHSEKETRETVNRFFEDFISLDAVIIDIYWFGAEIFGHMGNLEFLKDSFPTPKEMIDYFNSKGVKTILVTEPFILTTSNRWNEVTEKELVVTDSLGAPFTYDFYFGNTGLLDIYKTQTQEWFWNIYKDFTNMGVGGWWGDLGEPEVHPSEAQHVVGSADEVHNIYGHDWTRLIFEGYQKDFPEQRPFILMRAGYSGSQRYGIIPWTGDVSRSWGGLKPQMEISLQMGMQGIGYMHSDLGGFAGGEEFDSELYTRWLQYGIYQPIFRPHAQEHIPAEPVFHDEKTKSLARQSIEMRYSLLPYIYTIAFDNSRTGIPLMRPLFFNEPEKDELIKISNTYMWGNNFLVSPVVNAGEKQKEIYFPSNANWIDFYTDDVYEGGSLKMVDIVEDHIPVFVKGGSFIPMIKPIQTTEDYNTENMDLHFYFDASVQKSSGKLYDDDGITPDAFEKGQYEILNFTSTIKKGLLNIEFNAEVGENYYSTDRTISLIVHNLDNKPDKVTIDSKKSTFEWNDDKGLLVIPVKWKNGTMPAIDIKY